MIIAPISPNTVTIPIIQTGCLRAEFESTYPIHLNGIIEQDEFQRSIANINQAISLRGSFVIVGIIIVFFFFGGFILFIVGGATAVKSHATGFPVMVGVGFGLFGFGMAICAGGCCILQARYTSQMQKAIANESMKYSNRSPTPCSWRLNSTTTTWIDGTNEQQASTAYHIVIEIGRSAPSQTEYRYYPSNELPSYSSVGVEGVCRQCGTSNPNPMAKFCSSCGQPLST